MENFGVRMKDTKDLLLKLVRSEITGELLDFPEDFRYDFDRLIEFSKEHEMSQIVADALIKNGLIKDGERLETARRLIYYASNIFFM